MDNVARFLAQPVTRAFWLAAFCFIPGTLIGYGFAFISGGMSCCGGGSSPFKGLAPVAAIFLLPLELLARSGIYTPTNVGWMGGLAVLLVLQFTYFFTTLMLVFVGHALLTGAPTPHIPHFRSGDIEYCPKCGTQYEDSSNSYCRACGLSRRD